MAKKGTIAGIPLGALVVFIIGIIVVLYILKNKNLFRFGSPVTALATPAGGIYPDAADPHLYTTTTDGEIEQDGDRREPQLASGFNYLNTEATVFINYHGISDTLSVKLRGPKHSGIPDSDMCNNIHYFNLGSSNTSAFGKQWGHTEVYCNFGSALPALPENTWVGVKAIEWNDGDGVHFQSWIQNPEGSCWKLVADEVDNGSAGDCSGGAANPYITSPCASDSVSIGFRVDGLSGGGDVEYKGASVREIDASGGAVTTDVCGGSTVPTPTTPTTPPAEEEEEEEEPEEDEDNNDDDDDDDGGGGGSTGPGTRSQDPTTQRINSCSGLTGETYRGCVNGGAAVSRRRGNLARQPITRAMFSAYSPNYFKFNRRRIRIGNVR